MNLGFTEILLILVLALVLFGAKKLPEIGHSFGKAMREFKKGIDGTSTEIFDNKEEQEKKEAK